MMMSPTTAGVEWIPISPLFEIDLLIDAFDDADLEIEHAFFRERLNHRAGLGVELYELIAGCDVDHALVALAIGPVRDAAAQTAAVATRRPACLRAGCAPSSARPSGHRAR